MENTGSGAGMQKPNNCWVTKENNSILATEQGGRRKKKSGLTRNKGVLVGETRMGSIAPQGYAKETTEPSRQGLAGAP